MNNNTNFFDNKFDDPKITPQRLVDFMVDAKTRFTNNGNAAFGTIITSLGTASTNLQTEINSVDTKLNLQKGATRNSDNVLSEFKHTMSSEEPFIAKALGGKEVDAYLEFYPHMISEYSNATKEKMVVLTDRIFTAATNHAAALGTTLTTELTSYKAKWASVDTTQEDKEGKVEAARNTRSAKRIAAELVCMQALGTVTVAYPGNPEACKQLFDFSLLHATHHQHIYNVTLQGSKVETVVKHKFAADAQISVTTNGTIVAYLSSQKNGTDSKPITIDANTTATTIHISDFGVEVSTNHFLVIANPDAAITATVKVDLL